MMLALEMTAWLVALGWLWKAITAARGLPGIPNLNRVEYDLSPEGAPSITVIVPARNEASNIAATLHSLLRQDYDHLRILAIDDRSTDSTGEIMDGLAAEHPAKLAVLHVTELPAGWLGKTHAMALAARRTMALDTPDYLLFTDADVLFVPNAIRVSLAQAVATKADHFVTFPTPLIRSAGEGMLLGYLGVMGLWVTRPWLAARPEAVRDAIGIGAFNLLRTSAYLQLGGFDALRMEILEDLTLARRVKLAGLRQRVAMAPGMVSVHWAAGAFGVVDGMTKNLFAVFRFRSVLMLLGCLWIALFCVAPAMFLVLPATRIPGILACASVLALYGVSSVPSRISFWYGWLFPVAAGIFLYSILRSALITLKTGGVTWRGTFYSLDELRKNLTPLG
jgi:hypothetical protein